MHAFSSPKVKDDENENSEWHLQTIQMTSPIIPSTANRTIVTMDPLHEHPVDLTYRLRMKRNSVFYKRIFCAPIIGKIEINLTKIEIFFKSI